MQNRHSWFIVSILFLTTPIFVIPQNNSEIIKEIDIYMEHITNNGFSGALLIAKGGEILLSRGYGHANRERNIPINNQTIFTIGSITKQFTAAAILKLQMLGKLTVKDPISNFFINIPSDKASISIHHLLTHTAGFPGAIGDDFDPIERDDFVNLAMQSKLQRQPGELYEYSNVGYSLLGAIVELVSGQSYESFLQENLFRPAGMKKTGYLIPKWNKDDFAHGYRGNHDWGTLLDYPWIKDGPGWHLRANGGILSTIEDMYRWHLALQDDKILSSSAKTAYYHPHVREGENADSFYGYGWAIFQTPRNTRLIAHNGGNTIFAADFLRYLDEDVVIFAATNSAGKPAWDITRIISRIIFGYEYSLPPQTVVTMTASELKVSPMGIRAVTLLNIYAEADASKTRQFILDNFEPDYIKRVSVEKLLRFIQQDQKNIGELTMARAVKMDDNVLELTVQSQQTGEWWLVTLRFEEKSPYRITAIGVEDTQPVDESSEAGEINLADRWGLPNSITGHRSAGLLEVLQKQDRSYSRNYIMKTYSKHYLKTFPLENHIAKMVNIQKEIGNFELIGARKTGSFSASLHIVSSDGNHYYIHIELEEKSPHNLINVGLEPIKPE